VTTRYFECVNGKLRGSLLNGEVSPNLMETKTVLGPWRYR
jgi:hypothetical protein